MVKDTKEKLERLVKTGHYKNKSAAIRKIIEEHFQEHPELFAGEEMARIAGEADKMSDAEFDRLAAEILRGHRKTAAELVSEERDRSS